MTTEGLLVSVSPSLRVLLNGAHQVRAFDETDTIAIWFLCAWTDRPAPKAPFAANVLRLPHALLASASHPRTSAAVRAMGLPLHTVAIDELEKAEAGMTCLSLLLEQ